MLIELWLYRCLILETNIFVLVLVLKTYLIYLRLFQTLDTVDAAKAFIEDNKIAVIGFFKVHILIFFLQLY
jgi:hypothetical protein